MITFQNYIEIYITNECNLTCSNCNRYNNYDFCGHYSWEESKHAIQNWASRITAPLITIIGGEPALHPELEAWTTGILKAWPDSRVAVQTNGLINLNKFSWWTDLCEKFPNLAATIAVHSQTFEKKFDKLYYPGQQFNATLFTECTIKANGRSFTVHDSDPARAWRACTMKNSHTIFRGRLYQCPMVAILPEFQTQYQLDLTSDQQTLLDDYKSLEHTCTDVELQNFVKKTKSCMPQCGLCPEEYRESVVTFDPHRKKYPRRQN